MVVLNHNCEDLRPIGLRQSNDVGFEIVQSQPHIADCTAPDIAQVRQVFGYRIRIGAHVAVRVVVIGD